jgi:uncharacterized protein (TIGR03083 family)
MTKDEMFDAITAQRVRLADQFDGFTDDQWNSLSLCEGWRVRDVVGHLLSILEVPLGKFLFNIAKARSFDRYSDQVARKIGTRSSQALVAAFRGKADTRFSPPIVGPIAPLTDIYVHTRDIERPLGLPSQLHAAVLPTILNYVCGGKARGFVPSSRTAGLRFEATDLDWSIGSGPVVSGTGEAIMMAATARRVALADLTGAGVTVLTQRLG